MGLLHKARCGWGWATKSGVGETESSRSMRPELIQSRGWEPFSVMGYTRDTLGFVGHTASAASPQFYRLVAPGNMTLKHMAVFLLNLVYGH